MVSNDTRILKGIIVSHISCQVNERENGEKSMEQGYNKSWLGHREYPEIKLVRNCKHHLQLLRGTRIWILRWLT